MKTSKISLTFALSIALMLILSSCSFSNQEEINNAQDAVEKANKQVEEANKQVEEAMKDVEDAMKDVDEAGKDVDDAMEDVDDAMDDVDDAMEDVSNAAEIVNSIEEPVDSEVLGEAIIDLDLDVVDFNIKDISYWSGVALAPDLCGGALVRFAVYDGKLSGTAIGVDDEVMKIYGSVSSSGKITAGLGASDDNVASFNGQLEGHEGEGTWKDVYGCSGVFVMEEVDNLDDAYKITVSVVYEGSLYTIKLYDNLEDVYNNLQVTVDSVDVTLDAIEEYGDDIDAYADYIEEQAKYVEEQADYLEDLYGDY